MIAVKTTETSIAEAGPLPERADRYRVSVEEYIRFRKNGFLVVRGLVSPGEVERAGVDTVGPRPNQWYS